MPNYSPEQVCRRIAQLRRETAGPRGKSAFAKQLGLSPSTYDYYEASRVPPAGVLVRIAEATGVDLRWLLTGEPSSDGLEAEDHPVVHRAAAMLADCPDAAGPLAAFLDVLAAARKFPAKPPRAAQPPGRTTDEAAEREAPETRLLPAAAPPAHDREADAPPRDGLDATAGRTAPPALDADPAEGRADWIPVLGRSAAGVAHFWAHGSAPDDVTTLDDLIARRSTATATARAATASEPDGGEPVAVQVIALTAPDAEDVVEFVAAAALKRRYGDAFALRIDGDSMAPEIRHGDLVIVSPRAEAADGRAAVVQLAGQIGVTCKLFRRDRGEVHLVPINERYDVATFPADRIAWALRVLARVRKDG
jgi:SOS-response transcriptional repressor LexA/transcriptional regulator with XRE-family HTH domain